MSSYTSFFDVIGPNMIGPSSSHTAGAASIALMAKQLFHEEIVQVDFTLYGSFANTYRGHGTDRALLGGILGFTTDDIRIRDAFTHAQNRGLKYSFTEDHTATDLHPNTVDIVMHNGKGRTQFVRGVSIGGGRMKIVQLNHVDVDFTGEYSTLIIKQADKPGVVAHIAGCLAQQQVNIAFMRLYREAKGETAYTIIESDQHIPSEILDSINQHENIYNSLVIQV